jgi:glycosyltransferase involved in cell wall biosynthesis
MKKSNLHVFQLAIYEPDTGAGVAEWVYQTCNLLADEIQFSFIYFDLDKDEYYSEEIENGFCKLHFPKFALKGLILPKIFRKWLITIPERSIFHFHSVFRPLNFFVFRAILKTGHLTIFTPHDSYSKGSMRKNVFFKKLYLTLFDQFLLHNVDLVNAISREGVRDMKKLTKNEIFLTTNFFKDNELYNSGSVDVNKKQLCFIGRMDIQQKGLDISLEVFNRFSENKDYQYILIGGYNSEEYNSVLSILKQQNLQLNKEVLLTGFISEKEKQQILMNSLAYLQLSRFEGFGLSIVEAMSFGKPVIISDSVPISDKVDFYKAGFVVRNSDEAVLALAKIARMSETEYSTKCRNARKCYEEVYHPRAVKGRLLEMYFKVAKDR